MDAKMTRHKLALAIVKQLQKGVVQTADIARKIDPYAPRNSGHTMRVYRCLRSLERRGVVMGYFARLSLEKIGYPYTVFASISLQRPLDKAVLSAFEKDIRSIDQLIGLQLVDDPVTDYFAQFAFAVKGDFKRATKRIERCAHVTQVTLYPVLRVVHLPASPPVLRLLL